MPLDPVSGKVELASMTMLVDGKAVPDWYQLTQVRVHHQVNRIPVAKITLRDGSRQDENFPISESSALVPGKEVELMLGYHGIEQSVFKGFIVKHGLRIRDDESSLTLTCYSKAIKMTQGRKSVYLGKSDSDIFHSLITGAGLSARTAATTAVHDDIVKYYATDWDFMVCRAELYGQVVIANGEQVSVVSPALDAEPVLKLGFGNAVHDFDAELDARSQLDSVKCSAWDFSAQTVLSGTSTEPSVNEQGNISGKNLSKVLGLPAFELQSTTPLTADQLSAWADAQLLKSRLARLRGRVTFRGNASVVPGQMIELDGMGQRFDGTAFVAGVIHTIEGGGDWVTELEFGMAPQWFIDERADIPAPRASGRTPGVPGLQIAKVKQIDQDPDGQTRVLVEVPLIGLEGEGIWARLASGYATVKGGIFFIPEVGDEVILGFLNDDPSFPIILGSLYSTKQTPPYVADAPNTTKAIVTKAQLKISMNDVKKILQIETPGGHIVTLNDDEQTITIVDSNKNKLHMSSSGITLNSPGDIDIKADGSISLKAGASMTLKAETSMTANAQEVSIKAGMALGLNGEASAELKSGMAVTIKAPMVMIN